MGQKGHFHNKIERIYGQKETYRNFARALASGMNNEQAAAAVYGDSITDHAKKAKVLLHKEEVRLMVQEELLAVGAGPMESATVVAQGMRAKKLVGNKQVVDHNIRLRAAAMSLKLFDAFPKSGGPRQGTTSQHLHIYMQEPRAVREFMLRNGRLPNESERKLLGAGADSAGGSTGD